MEKTAEAFVKGFLDSLSIGEMQHKDGLSVFPLRSEIKSACDYLTLDEALGEKLLTVREIGEVTVPDIGVSNKGEKDVFIMDGEELIGAKQNRTVNISLIVPAGEKVKIPVSCVEAGRWHRVSESFAASEHISYAGLRRAQKESVMDSSEKTGEFRADQGETWDNIAEKAHLHEAPSETGAMSAIYEKESKRMAALQKAFTPEDGQIGGIFAVGKEIFGMDVFDKEDTWKKLMPKILKSYMLEILSMKKISQKPGVKEAEEFLALARSGKLSSQKSPGKGMTVSIAGKKAAGTSLLAEGTAVHTAVFSKSGEKEKPGQNVIYNTSASDRRERVYTLDGEDFSVY